MLGRDNESNTLVLSSQVYQINTSLMSTESNLTIFGNKAIIKCTGDVGLIVTNNSQVYIHNVTFVNCGAWQTTFSINSNISLKIAVHITLSSQVSLLNVNISDSDGIGLSLFNCKDKITIEESFFSDNKMKNYSAGGGGVYIQQYTLNNSNDSLETSYTISNCHFINNIVSSSRYMQRNSSFQLENTNDESHFPFGNGGGLSVNILAANHIILRINECNFQGNSANQGGGVYVSLLNDSRDNLIEILSSNFDSNECTIQLVPSRIISAGGGLAVQSTSASPMHNNTCLIKESCFTNNSALYGGGISVRINESQNIDSLQTDINIMIQDSHLTNNNARFGSAINLFCYWIYSHYTMCLMQVTLKNTNIIENNGIYAYNSYNNVEMKGITFSTIHLEGLKAHFAGNVMIQHNNATGVALYNAVMMVSTNAAIQIDSNTAVRGGGIATIGKSYVLLSPHTIFSIISNSAMLRGGGVYSGQIAKDFKVCLYLCFVKYMDENNRTDVHPDRWKTNITFSKNFAAGKPNSIFASSILPCVYSSGVKLDIKVDINKTFCGWKSWHFDKQCHVSIKTLPKVFSNNTYSVIVYPMIPTPIKDFDVFDDFMHNVINDTTFQLRILEDDKQIMSGPPPVLKGNRLVITGQPHNYKLLVQAPGCPSVSTIVNVTIQECPVGFKMVDKICKCDIVSARNSVQCNYENTTLRVLIGFCIGYKEFNNASNVIVVSRCPHTVNTNSFTSPYIEIQSTKEELNDKFCSIYNREGPLCKDCKAGNGIDVFSPIYECINCTNTPLHINLIKGIAGIIIPQTIFFILVIIFHVGITSPSMSAFIFFSHVISLQLEVLLIRAAWNLDEQGSTKGDNIDLPNILTNLVLVSFRIWSFDYPEILNIHVCFGKNFKIVHAIAFRYINAFYPILLVALTLVLIEIHAHNCKPVVYLWKPIGFLCFHLRKNWEVKSSVIHSFVTVILLSYSKVITTSLALLTFNYVYEIQNENPPVWTLLDYDTDTEYFKEDHKFFAVFALIILCSFGLIPPLLLLFYPFRWFKKLLSYLRLDRWQGFYIFVETFHGYLKDGTNKTPDRRWFSGMYFLFRIVVFLEFALINNLNYIFAILTVTYLVFLLSIAVLRPYKEDYYNNLDIIFMAILVTLNLLFHYIVTNTQQKQELSRGAWHMTYALLLVPTLYILLYLTYITCTHSKFVKNHCTIKAKSIRTRLFSCLTNKNISNTVRDDNSNIIEDCAMITPIEDVDEFPDRIDNPNRYWDLERSLRMRELRYHSFGWDANVRRGRGKFIPGYRSTSIVVKTK